jgi:hypothetical protein
MLAIAPLHHISRTANDHSDKVMVSRAQANLGAPADLFLEDRDAFPSAPDA